MHATFGDDPVTESATEAMRGPVPPRTLSVPVTRPTNHPDAAATLIAVASGVLAALAGASPTGSTVIDLALVAVSVALVTWVAAASPTVVTGAGALVAGALSGSPWLAALGVGAFGVAIWRRHDLGRNRALSAAFALTAMNIVARGSLGWFLGAETVVAIVVAVALTAAGLRWRSRRSRRLVLGAIVAYGAVAAIGTAATAWNGADVADDLRTAERSVDDALDQILRGDTDGARTSLETALDRLDTVESSMGSPVTTSAALVPVVAQHRRAALDVSRSAGDAMTTIVAELDAFDLDAVMAGPGTVDLAAVSELEAPMLDFQRQLRKVIDTVEEVRSPWLIDRVAEELDDLDGTVEDQLDRTDLAVDVIRTAPAMLGADEKRTYFLAFMTPSEVRGLGGLMGLWAEITAEDGRIEMSTFSRVDALARALETSQETFVIEGPQEWLSRYSEFGFAGPSSPPGTTVGTWGNVTMSPDSAATGQVIAQLYPYSGGRPIDGVFATDVIAVSRLLEITGPVTTSAGVTLDADNAAAFLLNRQYQGSDRPDRKDLLEEVARHVVDDLLGGSLPSPGETIDVLGPMVQQGRLVGWAAAAEEQALFETVGLVGGWPDSAEGDAFAVAFNNTTGNKLDYFLRARAHYDVVVDATTSTLAGTVLVELENRPPPSPQPDYVMENPVGLPRGHNRTWVSVYTRAPITAMTVDGRSVPWDNESEAGFFVASTFVTMAPGDTPAIELTLDGPVELVDGEYHLELWSPPTARITPVTAAVEVRHLDGPITTATAESRAGAASLVVEPPPVD